MLKFTDYLKTVFIDKKTMTELIELGFETNDAQYVIGAIGGEEYIIDKDETLPETTDITPTYSLGDLLCKLNEYPYVTIDGKEYGGPIKFFKDAPFYGFGYTLKSTKGHPDTGHRKEVLPYAELPLYGASNLLKWCLQNKVWYVKDITDIKERVG